MLVPDDLWYSRDHQWVRDEGAVMRVGLTHFAQEALGEVTHVLLAEPTRSIPAGDELGEVEAFKAMTDLYMPVEGTVVEHNPALADAPDLVNGDPYGSGWLCTIAASDPAAVEQLLSPAAYRELIDA